MKYGVVEERRDTIEILDPFALHLIDTPIGRFTQRVTRATGEVFVGDAYECLRVLAEIRKKHPKARTPTVWEAVNGCMHSIPSNPDILKEEDVFYRGEVDLNAFSDGSFLYVNPRLKGSKIHALHIKIPENLLSLFRAHPVLGGGGPLVGGLERITVTPFGAVIKIPNRFTEVIDSGASSAGVSYWHGAWDSAPSLLASIVYSYNFGSGGHYISADISFLHRLEGHFTFRLFSPKKNE